MRGERKEWIGRTVATVALACGISCDGAEPLRIRLADPCSGEAVLGEVEEISLNISKADGAVLQQVTWSAASGGAELSDVPFDDSVILSVEGRSEARGVLAAAGVGWVDLAPVHEGGAPSVGITLGRVDTFIRATDARQRPAECASMAARRGHSATALRDGRVLVLGGDHITDGGSTYWEVAEIYDPVAGVFRDGPITRGGRRDHSATVLEDGRVLIAGGYSAVDGVLQSLDEAHIWDPESGAMTGPFQLLTARRGHTATLLPGDGRVMIAGGIDAFGRAQHTTEIFDPESGTSQLGPTLRHSRAYHAAVRIGPHAVALIAGRNDGGDLASVEFAGSRQTESTAGPLLAVARSHIAVSRISGTDAILVAGGLVRDRVSGLERGSSALAIIRLDLQNLESSHVDCENVTLPVARGDAAMAALPDGFLMVGGRDAAGDSLASADALRINSLQACDFDILPTADELAAHRAGARAVALADGDVLVVGGYWLRPGIRPVTLGVPEIYIRHR